MGGEGHAAAHRQVHPGEIGVGARLEGRGGAQTASGVVQYPVGKYGKFRLGDRTGRVQISDGLPIDDIFFIQEVNGRFLRLQGKGISQRLAGQGTGKAALPCQRICGAAHGVERGPGVLHRHGRLFCGKHRGAVYLVQCIHCALGPVSLRRQGRPRQQAHGQSQSHQDAQKSRFHCFTFLAAAPPRGGACNWDSVVLFPKICHTVAQIIHKSNVFCKIFLNKNTLGPAV